VSVCVQREQRDGANIARRSEANAFGTFFRAHVQRINVLGQKKSPVISSNNYDNLIVFCFCSLLCVLSVLSVVHTQYICIYIYIYVYIYIYISFLIIKKLRNKFKLLII